MNSQYSRTEPYQDTGFPVSLTLAVVLLSIVPLILILSGVDFGHGNKSAAGIQSNSGFRHATGLFTHVLLEWSACSVAIFTAILAFSHYKVTHDPATPIIATALLCAGGIDAFNALAEGVPVIPFAWSISRIFAALILMVGVSVSSVFGQKTPSRLNVAILFSLVVLIPAYGIIYLLYPDNPITQRWDMLPLAIFLFCGIVLFPCYYKQYPSVFAYSLMLSMVPNVITELHMVFGTTRLFDSHFNAAHFLKVISYAVLFLGVVFDFARAYKNKALYQQRFTEAESQAALILQTVNDGIITIDQQGQIRMLNRAAEQIFGYTQNELLGRNIKILMPSPYHNKHDDYLRHYLETGEKNIIGSTGREVTALRKDGSNVPIDISVSEMVTQHNHTFTGIIRDITERKSTEKMLQQQMQELQRSNQELNRFAYVASHDLQEPLRMISSYMQLLEARYKDQLDDNAREFIGYAVDGAKRMQHLIQDLLLFSRLNTRTQEFEAVNANDLYHDALENLAIAIDESDTVATKDQLPCIYGHMGQLRQLFQNLIGNAVKYRDSNKQNKVHVSADQRNGEWRFCIEDNGIGIEAAYHEKIFIIFKRLHMQSDYPGTGIGLAICKKIVENHRGESGWNQHMDKAAGFVLPYR